MLSRRQALGLFCRVGSAALLAGCGLASGGASQGVSAGLLRIEHTATLLLDGSILVAGGRASGLLRAAQRVSPGTGRWSDAGQLSVARSRHTATRLPDGTVLLAGGDGADRLGRATATTERYDPARNRWAKDAAMGVPRMRHQALPLADGSVLVMGGITGLRAQDTPLAAVDRYDPATKRWHAAAPLNAPRVDGAAVGLGDGRVLFVGGGWGAARSAEIYDPATDRWTLTAPPHYGHPRDRSAVSLTDGRCFAVGEPWQAELYDARSDTWTTVPSLPPETDFEALVALPDARVLVFSRHGAMQYATPTGTWQTMPSLGTPRSGARAILLPDGTIAIVCGNGLNHNPAPTPLEIYRP